MTIDARRKVIQINDSEEEILPFYEIASAENADKEKIHRLGQNFAIGQVDCIGEPYKLKMQLYYEKKTDSVILDCEIAQKRTIVSNRVGERYSKVEFESIDGEVKEISAYELYK